MNPHMLQMPTEFSLSFLDMSEDIINDFRSFCPDTNFYSLRPDAADTLTEALILLTLSKFNRDGDIDYRSQETQFIDWLNNFGLSDNEANEFIVKYISMIASKIINYLGSTINNIYPEDALSNYNLNIYKLGSASFITKRVFSMNHALGRFDNEDYHI